jgi:hypothetical protein
MTQDEAFKAWWYTEGSQAPYTHHDCEEHTMRMCEIAWANGAYKALADHAMRETQRLGQEIESDDIASILACRDMLDAQPVPPRAEQEPLAWCSQFEHSCVQPPRRKPLTDEQIKDCLDAADQMYCERDGDKEVFKARAIEAAHAIKGDA